MAQPGISHEAAEQILLSQATRTDEHFPGIVHVSHQLALLRGHGNVYEQVTADAKRAVSISLVIKKKALEAFDD